MHLSWFRNKKILVTGHTGFKGAWLCKMLVNGGAEVIGYALPPPTTPSLYEIAGIGKQIRSVIGDVRDYTHLKRTFEEARPEIVLHLAAQPLVRFSYAQPCMTYETNVMGTVHICECVRLSDSVRSFLNVTTDKVYENREWEWGYRENEPLGGHDPYSNSKACSELVTSSYVKAFFSDQGRVAVSTARSGNVIGGGDFAENRIIPDCVRAVRDGRVIVVRNAASTRPYQHVLEPLFAYLMIAKAQYEDPVYAGSYNVGPDESDCVATGTLVDLFCRYYGEGASWMSCADSGPHEAHFLKLDCSRLKKTFSWQPRWHIDEAVEKTVAWTKLYLNKSHDVITCMERQIASYAEEKKHR